MKKLYILLFIIPLIFTSCEKDSNNTNNDNNTNTNNIEDYPNLILGTWYLETVKSTQEQYYIDPIFGTNSEVETLYSDESIDDSGTWITFEYDFDGYYGFNDSITNPEYFFNYNYFLIGLNNRAF